MGARKEARRWAAEVEELASVLGARYEPVGGINAVGEPAALCVGGTNRISGRLTEDFWGAACDALERREGGMLSKAVIPHGGIAKAHVPDVAEAVPPFAVEDITGLGDRVRSRTTRNQVHFESIGFNRRFLVTVPSDYDGTAIHELFSPATIDWATGLEVDCDFGIMRGQMFCLWRYRKRSIGELRHGLDASAQVFRRLRAELHEAGVEIAEPGPWHAGLGPFPGR